MDATGHTGAEAPLRVLIAGGGVAALEALLALCHHAPGRFDATLIAPDPEFRYRPLSVTEPFRAATPRHADLAEIALEHGHSFRKDALAAVDSGRRVLSTTGGAELEYDALLIAIGTLREEAVPGAVTFRDSADRGAVRGVLDEIEAGDVRRLAFAVPAEASWPLGLYELALLTSARAAELGIEDLELALVSPEEKPLAVFGSRASAAVAQLLEAAEISFRPRSKPRSFEDGRLVLDAGTALECDRVVALPVPRVAPIPGLPQDAEGFIPIDRHAAVLGLEREFAAGDAAWFPIKQGGLAAQQADCAARSIAALAGAPVEPQVFRPVLRGALLTGWGPRYLRTVIGEDAGSVARSVLWWPPAKIAGEHLAPYLMAKAGYRAPDRALADLAAPPGDDATDLEAGHEDVVRLALGSADAHARSRDFAGALRWLEVAEDLDLYLPGEYERKRISWTELERRR